MEETDKIELERRIDLLESALAEGTLNINSADTIQALRRVKRGPDGRVDLTTVEASVRALANSLPIVEDQQELASIPLRDVQEKYFEELEALFGGPYAQMLKHKSTPRQIAESMANKPSIVKAFSDEADAFQQKSARFWKSLGPIVEAHLQEAKGLKSIYGGDFFPPSEGSSVLSSALYVDTLVLPDPMLRAFTLFPSMKPEAGLYYLVKHALSALSLKSLVLDVSDPPAVVIAPDYIFLDDAAFASIRRVGQRDVLTHVKKMFNKPFESYEEAEAFLASVNTFSGLKSELAAPERLLFDSEIPNSSLEEQWSRGMEDLREFKSKMSDMAPGTRVKMHLDGRMMLINDMLYKSNKLSGVPLVDAPTSWQYLLWKYEYDAGYARDLDPAVRDMLIVNSFNDGALSWLGGVPTDVIVRLRQEGALGDLRNLFSQGVRTINDADEGTYRAVVKDVSESINARFMEHQKEIGVNASRTKKFFGYDVAPWIVIGGISMAAVATGNVPLGLLSTLAGHLGLPGGRELRIKGKELAAEKARINTSPVGLLFNVKKQQQRRH